MHTLEKIKVAALDDLTPLIGKKVIVKDKQIGLFLTCLLYTSPSPRDRG